MSNGLDRYCELIRKLPCPISGRTDQLLNGSRVESVVSFVILTQRESRLIVACPDELDKACNNASIRSTLLGLWGIPWGTYKSDPEKLKEIISQ